MMCFGGVIPGYGIMGVDDDWMGQRRIRQVMQGCLSAGPLWVGLHADAMRSERTLKNTYLMQLAFSR